MKRIFVPLSIAAIFIVLSCSQSSQKTALNNGGAAIEFESLEHDFGTIPYKGDGTTGFTFRNTGKEPLILKNVRSTCGCTVPEWPKDPIKKGERGTIKVKYNTRITGSFSKSINVYSNAGETPITLVIKGKVEAAEKEMTTGENE